MSAVLARLARQTRPSRLSSLATAAHQTFPRASTLYPRTYATTTKGDQPNATNLAPSSPKPSDSENEADIKSSRANDGGAQMESGTGLSRPVSEATESTKQADEEGGDPTKKDTDKPADEKRAETLEGQDVPLDAGERQNTAEQMAGAKEQSPSR